MKEYLIVAKNGFNKRIRAKSILDAIQYSQIHTNMIVLATVIIDSQENQVETVETEM